VKYIYIIVIVFFQKNLFSQKYIKPLFDFKSQESIFQISVNKQANLNRMLRYYALTGYREGVNPVSGIFGLNYDASQDEKLGTLRLYMYNLTLAEMLTHGFVKKDRIILDVKDPSKYLYIPKYGSMKIWMRNNAHCFELMQPNGVLDGTSLNIILSDIFGVEFGMEKRKVKAMILARTSKKELFKSSGVGKNIQTSKGRLKNVTFQSLIDSVGYIGMPFIDESNYNGLIDIDLKIMNWRDINLIKKKLKKYDLELREDMRELDMFVIKEKEENNED